MSQRIWHYSWSRTRKLQEFIDSTTSVVLAPKVQPGPHQVVGTVNGTEHTHTHTHTHKTHHLVYILELSLGLSARLPSEVQIMPSVGWYSQGSKPLLGSFAMVPKQYTDAQYQTVTSYFYSSFNNRLSCLIVYMLSHLPIALTSVDCLHEVKETKHIPYLFE